MKKIGMYVVVLLAVGVFAISARTQIPPQCQYLPTSTGLMPESCADALLEQRPKAAGLETSISRLVTDRAFGIESINGNLVSLELNAPEVLTQIGPVGAAAVGPNGAFITACDFDNTATFTYLCWVFPNKGT